MTFGDLKIRWFYTGRRRKLPTATNCEILDRTSGSIVGTGKSCCMSSDTFDKEKGRKGSLTKALTNIPRDLRFQVWEWYRTLPKTPRWPAPTQKSRAKVSSSPVLQQSAL